MAQLTVPTKGPSFTAKKDGHCRLCRGPIVAKVDFICEVERLDSPHVHTHCADGYIRRLKENLEAEAGGDL